MSPNDLYQHLKDTKIIFKNYVHRGFNYGLIPKVTNKGRLLIYI